MATESGSGNLEAVAMRTMTDTPGPRGGALVFIGFMGAGKTSVARAVAAERGERPVDSDAELERALGTSIEQFFDQHGEAAFRTREEETVCALLDAPPASVISLGGGSVTSTAVQERLAGHTVVLLDVDADLAWRRAGSGSHRSRRPLARDRRRFRELHAQRQPLYEQLADAILTSEGRDEVRRAMGWVNALADAPAGVKLLWATSASGNYPVYVGDGALRFDPFGADGGRRFLITDEHVAPLHGEALGPVEQELRLPPGEQHKTLASAEWLLRRLAESGMARDDRVAALGGGVVGDVAGFCAAIYQRGVPVVQLPTTLVAQVDSAYGGKTGVDLPEGKNYAGAYHQPLGVLADPSTLQTLPDEELAAGWAEVIKTGLIAGGALWKRVRDPASPVDRDLVLACARVKLGVVASDERDAGARQVLNLGHTVGHAIETATQYARYRHGEAVGLGLLAMLTLSELHHLRGNVAELLAARGLPTRLDPEVDREAVLQAVARDKKKRAGEVGFVLLDGPGEPRIGVPVAEDALRGAIEELAR